MNQNDTFSNTYIHNDPRIGNETINHINLNNKNSNSTSISSPSSIDHLTTRFKRDRPKSSYFENFQHHTIINDNINENDKLHSNQNNNIILQQSNETTDVFSSSPQIVKNHDNNVTIQSGNCQNDKKQNNVDREILTSPLFNRVPFKNLSNLPNSIKKNTKSLTKSMTDVVSKSSQTLFANFHVTTPKSSSKCSNFESKLDEKISDEYCKDENSFQDDDTFDTIVMDSPIQKKSSDTNTTRRNNDVNEPSQPNVTNVTTPQIRRFHSLCQTTKELENFKLEEDNSNLKYSTIKTFNSENDLLPRINEDQLYKILCGDHNTEFEKFVIVDCRFDYEYQGGHINEAINIPSKDSLEEKFIDLGAPHLNGEHAKVLLIFHCEYSIFRGPVMAKHLRKCDRKLNSNSYPFLSYPDIVILEGGYKNFFQKYQTMCFPQNYVEMKDINHQKSCKANLNKIRKSDKLLTRAKSFNYRSLSPSKDIYHNRSESYSTNINEKILKRQRSNSKVNETTSRLTRANTFSFDQPFFSNSYLGSPITNESLSIQKENDQIKNVPNLNSFFQPPTTSFRNANKTYSFSSSSSVSINSNASINSDDLNSGFNRYSTSSVESLNDPYTTSSPFIDEGADYFDRPMSRASLIKPVSRKPKSTLPSLPPTFSKPSSNSNLKPLQFQFPHKKLNTNHNFSIPLTMSHSSLVSPTIDSSPLMTPNTNFENYSTSSIIDPINDKPLDFSIPMTNTNATTYKKFLHKRSGSLFNSSSSAGGGVYNFTSQDISEEGEEQEE